MSGEDFERAALAMYRNGYSVLPVGAGTKVPGIYRGYVTNEGKGPWFFLRNWNELCDERASEAQVGAWGRMADRYGGGLGLACGFGGLVAVDIDDDSLVEPLLKVLPSVLVAKKGRKGLTAFYRVAQMLDSRPYDADGKGRLLDFLSRGRRTVLPPSCHPDTGEPYRWTTDRKLLDTPLEDLPVFTEAHRAKMEEVLRAHGWDASAKRQPRSGAVERPDRDVSGDMLWHDDVNTVALERLSAWVPKLALPKGHWLGDKYRAVAPWRLSGSGRPMSKRHPNLSFHPTGIQDFGTMETFTPVRVVAKAQRIPYPAAAAWLREQLGMPDERLILLNAGKSGKIQPTYPDRALPLADATTELRGALDGFEAEMKAWRIYRNECRIKPPLIHRKPPVRGVRIETGGGKTHEASRKVPDWIKRGWRLAYVVPRIDLGDNVARALANLGIKAQVYRGREQDDPDTPGKQMCQNLVAAKAATDLGISVRPAVCLHRIEEKLVQCPFASVCGHEKQREAKPDVWIVTSMTLLYERPDFIPEIDGLVLDERFHDNAVGDAVMVDAAALWREPTTGCFPDEEDFLLSMRAKLMAVTKGNGNGPLSRAVLYEHKIFAHNALRAATLEQRRVNRDALHPGMQESGIDRAVKEHKAGNKLARAAGAIWEEIALFLTFDHSQSGRINIARTSLTLTPLRPFHPSWYAPVVALAATLATPEILAVSVFGDDLIGASSTVSVKADIAIQWPENVRVRQVMRAPVSMGALGLGENARPKQRNEKAKQQLRNEKDIRRYIRQRAALIAPARLGVISYLGLEERLSGQVPPNVRWMHFGATSGLNDFETVAGLVVIGRWWLLPKKIEAKASVFAGYPVKPIGEFYWRRTGGIRMTDGSAVPATVECHPDPFAEAVRWCVTEAELLQAVGRLRPHRRSAPCFLDIVGPVVLPITVDEVVEWGDIKPGAEADMLAQGVVLSNSRDARAAFGLSKRDAEEAETAPTSLIRTPIKEVGAISPLRKFTYRREGTRGPASTGYYLPGVMPGGVTVLRAWLQDRLGCRVAFLTVERVKATPVAAAKIGRVAVEFVSKLVQSTSIEGFDES